jgi:ferric-dicitrate binding protein FerR (iron transport regulator)
MHCLGATSVRILSGQQDASRKAKVCRSSEQIEQLAAEYLAKQDGQEWGPQDQAALNAWLDESVSHRIAYIRLAEAWRRVAQLSRIVRR